MRAAVRLAVLLLLIAAWGILGVTTGLFPMTGGY